MTFEIFWHQKIYFFWNVIEFFLKPWFSYFWFLIQVSFLFLNFWKHNSHNFLSWRQNQNTFWLNILNNFHKITYQLIVMTITNENRYGLFKNDVIEIGEEEEGGTCKQWDQHEKKILFSLEHGQCGSSWALVSNPLVVLFQALAWVAVTSLYCPSSKDNDPEYACAYCRKTCTTKALLELHLKAIQHHSNNVVGKDESETENVGFPVWKSFWWTRLKLLQWKDLLEINFICCYILY